MNSEGNSRRLEESKLKKQDKLLKTPRKKSKDKLQSMRQEELELRMLDKELLSRLLLKRHSLNNKTSHWLRVMQKKLLRIKNRPFKKKKIDNWLLLLPRKKLLPKN